MISEFGGFFQKNRDTITDEVAMNLRIAMVGCALLTVGYGQTAGDRSKLEFDVASIRVSPPRVGFHFPSSSSGSGPDLTNPGLFRCTECTLATLIKKAFDLQNYQFPVNSALGNNTFEVMAKLPAGATPEDFRAMLQNLLKDRFGLTFHYKEKTMRGYHLVVAKNGSKLKESKEIAGPPTTSNGQHGYGQGQGQAHKHEGLVAFGGSATYRGDHKTTGEIAQLLSDQLSVPVDDQTQLQGKYDVALNWAGNNAQSGGNHAEGGGAGHGDHGGGGPAGAAGLGPKRGEESGPTLFEAVQSQLGLKLVASEQTIARVFVVDHAEQLPTAN